MKRFALTACCLALGASVFAVPARPQGRTPVERTPAGDVTPPLRGVIVTAGTEKPVPGVRVHLKGPEVKPRSTVSSSEGRFEFEWPPDKPQAQLWVTVDHPEDVRVWPTGRMVMAGANELRFVARPVATQTFRGVVIDRRTGLPVPFTSVRLSEFRGPQEIHWTDESGRFESRVPMALGTLIVTPIDDHENRFGSSNGIEVLHVADPPPGGVECLVTLSPRFELEFEMESGIELGDYRVELRPRGSHPASGWVHGTQRVMLHAGEPPWIRPARKDGWRSRMDTRARQIHLLSLDGFSAAVADAPQGTDGAVELELRPRGALAFRLKESVPTPPWVIDLGNGTEQVLSSPHVRHGASLWLEPLGEPAGRRAISCGVPIGKEKRVRWIEPGAWRAELKTPYFEDQALLLDVRPHEVTPVDIVLRDPAPIGQMCVRIIDGDGDFEPYSSWKDAPRVSAVIQPTGPDDKGRGGYTIEAGAMCGSGTDAWFRRVQHAGRWVLEATIDGVPPGAFDVHVLAHDRALDVKVKPIRSGETAEFRLLPKSPERHFGFRVTDPDRPGQKLAYSVTRTRLEPGFPIWNFGDEHCEAFGVKEDLEFEWALKAPGYKTHFGDRSDFVREPDGYWCDVLLERGFSARFEARLESGEPASGVAIEFDGRIVFTGRGGSVLLETSDPAPQGGIELHGGWRRVSGDVAEDGSFSARLAVLRVVVRR